MSIDGKDRSINGNTKFECASTIITRKHKRNAMLMEPPMTSRNSSNKLMNVDVTTQFEVQMNESKNQRQSEREE